jgi:streptogramin lyase
MDYVCRGSRLILAFGETDDDGRRNIESTWEKFHPTSEPPAGHHYTMYQVISDSKNNLWMAEFQEGYLGTIDAKTHAVKWFPLPTPHARARRMEIDDQDRIVATEYRGNKVAVFDTRTEKFTEYPLPPYTFPYRANFDKNGAIWASTMSTDRVVHMDPKTGATEQYLMPSETNMRTLYVDNSTTPVSFESCPRLGKGRAAGLMAPLLPACGEKAGM